MSCRSRNFAAVLVALAVFSQLITPTLHASNWAKHNGDGLLYAFCGTLSPALLAKMRSIAPDALLERSDNPQTQTELCLSMGTLAGSLILAAVFVLLLFQRQTRLGTQPRLAHCAARPCSPYQSRAPPCNA